MDAHPAPVKTSLKSPAALLVTVCLTGLMAACGQTVKPEASAEETDWKGDPVWKEAATALPDYPLRQNLLPIVVDSPNEYFVDADSVSRLSDGVVRYTVLIRSSSGIENVFHEGLRCETNQFKTYAYGIDGRFREYARSEWRLVFNRGARAHTGALRDTYVCGEDGWPLRRKDILKRVRQGGWDAGTPAYDPE